MNFEMDVEVRPQFEVPNYTGLKVKRPVAELTDKHVDEQLTRFLEGHGQIVPKLEGAAELGDYLTADLTFLRPDGQPLERIQGSSVPAPAGDSFPGRRDRRCERAGRGQAGRHARGRGQAGVVGGRSRPCAERRQPCECQVIDLKRLRLPDLNQAFLDSINVDSVESLREAVRATLERRIRTEQRQAMRRQLLDQLLATNAV